MANVKKVIVPATSLIAKSGEENTHFLRFRVISEDRNRISEWSPIYAVNPYPLETEDISYSIDVSVPRVGNKIANVFWTVSSLFENSSFDVYARWMGSAEEDEYAWQYLGTRQGTSISSVIPTNTTNVDTEASELTTHFQIAVQTLTYPKQRFEESTLFVSNTILI
jgi:hypothetical protein